MSQPSLATAWASIWSLRRNCAMHHKPVRPALVNLIVGRLPIVAAIAFDARIGMRRPVTKRPIIPGAAGREACHQNGHQEQANASSGVIRLGASLQKRCKVRWPIRQIPTTPRDRGRTLWGLSERSIDCRRRPRTDLPGGHRWPQQVAPCLAHGYRPHWRTCTCWSSIRAMPALLRSRRCAMPAG